MLLFYRLLFLMSHLSWQSCYHLTFWVKNGVIQLQFLKQKTSSTQNCGIRCYSFIHWKNTVAYKLVFGASRLAKYNVFYSPVERLPTDEINFWIFRVRQHFPIVVSAMFHQIGLKQSSPSYIPTTGFAIERRTKISTHPTMYCLFYFALTRKKKRWLEQFRFWLVYSLGKITTFKWKFVYKSTVIAVMEKVRINPNDT